MTDIRTVVATGTTGYLGRHVTQTLRSMGINVVPIVRKTSQLNPDSAGIVIGDDEALVATVIAARPDVVLHMAATGGVVSTPSEIGSIIRSNVTLGALLMEACAELDTAHFVAIGSFSQHSVTDYGEHPNSFYAASKGALESFAEYFAAARGLHTTFLLPTDIYGPGDDRKRLLKLLAEATESATPIDVTPGDQIVSFVHVLDVVDAIVHVLSNETAGQQPRRFGISGPEVGSLRDTMAIIESALHLEIPVRWGKRPYRDNEVLVPRLLDPPPGWFPRTSVTDGFQELLKEIA